MTELASIQLIILGALAQQLSMGAHFHHMAVLDDENMAGVLIVERRWATTKLVRPFINVSIPR
jgi:hypothetical protein